MKAHRSIHVSPSGMKWNVRSDVVALTKESWRSSLVSRCSPVVLWGVMVSGVLVDPRLDTISHPDNPDVGS